MTTRAFAFLCLFAACDSNNNEMTTTRSDIERCRDACDGALACGLSANAHASCFSLCSEAEATPIEIFDRCVAGTCSDDMAGDGYSCWSTFEDNAIKKHAAATSVGSGGVVDDGDVGEATGGGGGIGGARNPDDDGGTTAFCDMSLPAQSTACKNTCATAIDSCGLYIDTVYSSCQSECEWYASSGDCEAIDTFVTCVNEACAEGFDVNVCWNRFVGEA